MAYECPVCDALQADGQHLANHLAITGLLHDDEHASWLEDRVPDWSDRSPESLAAEVIEDAKRVDATPPADPAAEPPSFEGAVSRQVGRGRDRSDEVERILANARELTERMRGADDGDAR